MDLDSVDHPGRIFSLLSRDLKSLAISNIQFFQNGKQSHHAKFHMSFSLLYEYLDVGIEPSYRELSKHLHLYDFSPDVKGNGYRSLLQVVHKCCLHLLQLSRYIATVKDSMLFRKRYYAKELEAYVSALGQLRAILYYALKLINYCQEGELFADEERLDNSVADHLMMEVESLNQECFYGRCLGFQFCESMMRPVQIMNIAMASYSEGYLESSSVMQVATSVFNSGKYFMDPELRATQLAKVTRTADIGFCKAFWSISESGLVQQLPSMVCPSVEVNEFFPLGPDAFELPLVDGSDTVVITPPCAHVGPGHVMVRLLSVHLREGQQTFLKSSKAKSPVVAKPRTPGLIVHIHGGGFIAQSSKSHEMYLRDWARILEIPILSVDYSLAPELPFPRALEDCFYAYAWAVKNCLQLGSLGERIIMCGDSAGGNLAISTAMRAASFGIRRPDGIMGVYPVTMVRYLPSPARLLSLMDPILPVGIVSRCLAAYAGINEEHPLASPSTQEFQSKSSLDSIKMQTAESSDNEWVIIGQDKDECDQIGKRIDQSPTHTSPVSVPASKSVIDSLEDSFHEDLEEEMVEGKRKLCRSDTLESDEIEIFSQPREAGGCVLSNDKSVKENKDRKLKNSKDTWTVSGKEAITENLMSIHETAKSVMEGAQSMFTSLSSYIPARVSAAATTTNPTSSSRESQAVTKNADFYINRSVSSDTVDPSSAAKSEDDCVSFQNLSKCDEFSLDGSSISEKGIVSEVISGSSLFPSRQKSGESVDDNEEDDKDYQQFDKDSAGECENDEREKGVENDGDVLDGNRNAFNSSHNSSKRNLKIMSSQASLSSASPLSCSSPSLCNSTSEQSATTRHPLPATHEKNIPQISSPSDCNRDHNFDSISLVSDDGEALHTPNDLATMIKPSVGTSPVVESASENIVAVTEMTMTSPHSSPPSPFPTQGKPTTDKPQGLSLPISSSQSHSQNSAVSSQQHQQCQDSSPSSNDPNLVFPTSVPSPNPTTTITPLPTFLPSTFEPANQENPTTMTPSSTSSSPGQFLTPDHPSTQTFPDNSTPITSSTVVLSPDDKDRTKNNSPQPLSSTEFPGNKENDTGANPSNFDTNSSDDITPKMSSSPIPSPPLSTSNTTTPKPPSDLNLFPIINVNSTAATSSTTPTPSHIYHTPPTYLWSSLHSNLINNHRHNIDDSLSPSPNRIFSESNGGSDLESSDTDVDRATFKTSCLEFLGPSTTPLMPNDEAYYASQHSVSQEDMEARLKEGMMRSDSAPVFSALFSPMTPVDPEVKSDDKQQLPFPNGFKMGMSPSDFKRQNFTPHSPINTMRKALVVRNPYMSPLMAEPELLQGLPPVCIVASHLDPLLDDSVMFAKRIRRLNVPVELHLVDDLPHGFLNFSMISQEAKKASQFCAHKLLEMINKDSEVLD